MARKKGEPKPARTVEEILAARSCTVAEAARVLEISWNATHAKLLDGSLHSFAVGKRQRVAVASLRACLGIQAEAA